MNTQFSGNGNSGGSDTIEIALYPPPLTEPQNIKLISYYSDINETEGMVIISDMELYFDASDNVSHTLVHQLWIGTENVTTINSTVNIYNLDDVMKVNDSEVCIIIPNISLIEYYLGYLHWSIKHTNFINIIT